MSGEINMTVQEEVIHLTVLGGLSQSVIDLRYDTAPGAAFLGSAISAGVTTAATLRTAPAATLRGIGEWVVVDAYTVQAELCTLDANGAADPVAGATFAYSHALDDLVVPVPDKVLNVRMFGAVGDGTTDDTSAIQAAIDAAGAVSGASVYLPAGVYVLDDDDYLAMYDVTGVTLFGDGPGISVLRLATGSAPISAMKLEKISDVALMNLTLDGNSAAAGNRHGILVYQGCSRVRFTNLQIIGFDNTPDSDGIYINDSLTYNSISPVVATDYLWITDCDLSENGRNGISIISAQHVWINRARTYGNGLSGILIEPNEESEVVTDVTISEVHGTGGGSGGVGIVNAYGATVSRVDVSQCIVEGGQYGFYVYGANHVQILGVTAVDCTSHGIYIRNGASEITIASCWVTGCGGNGIAIGPEGGAAPANVRIANCVIKTSAFHGISVTGSTNVAVNGGEIANNSQASANVRHGILFSGCTSVIVTGARIYDDQGTKTQSRGIQCQSSTDYIVVVANDLRGNAFAGYATDSTETVFEVAHNLT